MTIAHIAAQEINSQILPEDRPQNFLPPEVECIDRTVIATTRWTEIVQETFEMEDGSYLALSFEEGLTEHQECPPEGHAREVVPEVVSRTVYVSKDYGE